MNNMDSNYFFFFETNNFDNDNYLSYYFQNPVKIISLSNPSKLEDFFYDLTRLVKGYYVAGFFSYELGYILEDAFKSLYNFNSPFPFACFCAYEKPVIFDHRAEKFISGVFMMPDQNTDYCIKNLCLNTSEKEYAENIGIVKDFISKGDIYQANYTIKYNFDFEGSPLGFYMDLKRKQHSAYNVFAAFDDYHILSLSPELFYRKKGDKITVKPMKGTYMRGRNNKEDEKNRLILANDTKNQSENVMIVDLLRNDIGKVSQAGSVKVTGLYNVEKYNSLFQMTSTVESVLEKDTSIYDLIRSIFPSGSITGAPKIRSMEIIKAIEKGERKIYTGSIGFFEPSGDSIFNVAIRTVLLHGNKGEMGVGGAVVYDSTSGDEFDECRLKANFLVQKPVAGFSLIETILYNNGFEYLDLHLNRMNESAEYFDYSFNKDALLRDLYLLSENLEDGRHKIRILLDRFGNYIISDAPLERGNNIKEYKIKISDKHTDGRNIFLFHKTSNRDMYEAELRTAREEGFFDVIFLNEKNEITEGTVTNIYVKINGDLFTPPVECGLLNGIVRHTLLSSGKAKEKIIDLNDIKNAEHVYISNSIIGFREAVKPV